LTAPRLRHNIFDSFSTALISRRFRTLLRGAKRIDTLSLSGSMCSLGVDAPSALSHCAQLSVLDLSANDRLRDEEIKLLCDGTKIRTNLVSLDLSNCGGITAAGFETVFRRLGGLKRLVLRGCAGLTDISFEGMFEALEHLQRLDLSDCGGVGDDALRMIGAYERPSLTAVLLRNCASVTDTGVRFPSTMLLFIALCAAHRHTDAHPNVIPIHNPASASCAALRRTRERDCVDASIQDVWRKSSSPHPNFCACCTQSQCISWTTKTHHRSFLRVFPPGRCAALSRGAG